MHLLPSTRKRANLFGLPPGGRWHFRKKMTEGACGIIAYHSPQKEYFSFVHAGSSHRYRGPPSSRRRALSKRHPSLTLSSPSTHRHSLFSTTRLSRGFRFTKIPRMRFLHTGYGFYCFCESFLINSLISSPTAVTSASNSAAVTRKMPE